MKRSAKAPKKYHHGNLRSALVETAARMADENGIETLSLRRVALQLKVSHAAPYHHFKSKADLIAAIAEEGFSRLEKEMEAACLRFPDAQPRELVRELGMAYIHFAIAFPQYFRVMFRPELFNVMPEWHPEKPDRSFRVLVQVLQRHLGETGEPSPKVLDLALFAWSTVHGLASLWLDGSLEKAPSYVNQPVEAMASRVIDLFLQCI